MTRLLILLALALLACGDPAGTPAPIWEKGPGCTLFTMHPLGNGNTEIVAQRFDHCLRVEWDSTLVTR